MIKVCKDQKNVPRGKVRFDFDFFYNDSRYRKRINCQKSVVQDFYREWEKEIIAKHVFGDFKLFEIFDEYLKFSSQTKSPKNVRNERTVINNIFKVFFDKDILLKDVKRAHVEDFKVWRRTHGIETKFSKPKTVLSNARINRDIAILSYFFNWAIRKEYFKSLNPCSLSKLREVNKREILITNENIGQILKTAKEIDERFFSVVFILLFSGMRKGELLSLVWNNVDFENSRIVLSKSNTKNQKMRVIPVTPSLKDHLFTLFENKTSNKVISELTEVMIQDRWNVLVSRLPFMKLLDGRPARLHDTRHIYAQYCLNEGMQLEDIQQLLGHESLVTTQSRYAQFARGDLLEKVKVLDTILH